MTYRSLTTLLGLLLAAAPVACAADDDSKSSTLINLDTPFVTGHQTVAAHADVRVFGGSEDTTYSSLAVRYGIGRSLEASVRGAFAERKSLLLTGGSTIRHGGSDVELLLKAALPPVTGDGRFVSRTAGLIGVSFPNTPAQDQPILTLGSSFSIGNDRFTAFLNPHAVFPSGNTIVGLGVGAGIHLSDSLQLVADYTPILSGHNTRDTGLGAAMRRDVYGAAIRYADHTGRWSLDLGYTNATGQTTGFSLTPGLGGSGAFYIALSLKR